MIRWHVLLSLVIIHLAAVVAWWTFTWEGVILLLVLYQATGLGITIGYHRYLTHDSFTTSSPIRILLTLLGMSAAQGTPLEWVAVHRKHHDCSDTEEDPHSPHHGGFFWSHIAWLWAPFTTGAQMEMYEHYAPNLLRDPNIEFLSKPKVYLAWVLLTAMAIALMGLFLGGPWMCFCFVIYGVFLRLIVVYHITWLVNSATHLWGYQSHKSGDQSRNLWWVALLSGGEGWHNNHHGNQRAANHGQRWYEPDISGALIKLLANLRLAWNVSWYNTRTDKVEILYRRH